MVCTLLDAADGHTPPLHCQQAFVMSCGRWRGPPTQDYTNCMTVQCQREGCTDPLRIHARGPGLLQPRLLQMLLRGWHGLASAAFPWGTALPFVPHRQEAARFELSQGCDRRARPDSSWAGRPSFHPHQHQRCQPTLPGTPSGPNPQPCPHALLALCRPGQAAALRRYVAAAPWWGVPSAPAGRTPRPAVQLCSCAQLAVA